MSKSKPTTISEQLRKAMERDGRTAYMLGKLSGVDPGVIARFMQGKRDIRLETVDRIASVLDLVLIRRS
jgi:hypothetical protein